MPNVMATLPNIGGALCSMPQSFDDAQYYTVFTKKHPLLFSFITPSQISQFAQKIQHL